VTMKIEGAEPREPRTFGELRLFVDVLAFMSNPTAASKRLGESASELRVQFERQQVEQERVLQTRTSELDRKEEGLRAWQVELEGMAATLKKCQDALTAAVAEFDIAASPTRRARAR
jgi:hypothetical protein